MKKILLLSLLFAVLASFCSAEETATITSVADTGIRDATNTYGSDPFMYIFGTPYTMGYVRFDLTPLSVYTVVDARLVMTTSGGAPRNDNPVSGRFAVHGLNNVEGNTPQNWDEATLNRSNTGLEVEWTGQTLDIAGGRIVNLDADDGVGTTESVVLNGDYWLPGNTLTLTDTAGGSRPLLNFLQSRVNDNGLVTFIIRQDGGGARGYGLATKENATELYWPALQITYIPGGAVEPQPEDGSTVTDLNLSQLCWKNMSSDHAIVWFGQADANEFNYKSLLTPLAVIDDPDESECLAIPAEYLPLDVPSTYTWAVESWKYPAYDPNKVGEPNEFMNTKVWKFYTSAIPLVETSPTDQYKFPGETATFTATFESLTELTGAVWSLNGTAVDVGDPDVDVAVNALGDYQYSTTLTLQNVSVADEGAYTCVGENAGGSSSPTGIGYLIIKRNLAQWGFDGNADDATGVYNGTLYGDPNFVTDGVHTAMEFDGVNDYVQLPAGFANFRSGMTCTVWAKPIAANTWARFFDFGNGAGVDNVFLTRNGTTTNLTFNTYNGSLTANGAIGLDEWQFFAVSMTETGAVTLYKNGLVLLTGTVGLPAVAPRTLNYIGESNWEADALYRGLMDDLRIYNYALDSDTLATMYSDTAGRYCRVRPALDWDGNCIVDITDFATFAESWLECGLWPDCDL